MAMPRKKTRRITVDTVEYRWALSNNTGAMGNGDYYVIVELADSPAGKLLSKPTAIDQDFGDDYDYTITPTLIASGIRKAIGNGWVPSDPGTFRLPCPYDSIR